MTEEEKLIQEQLNKLPPNVRSALSSTPWKELVGEIGAAANLSPDQLENLTRETMLVLYGFENPAEYINKLIQEIPLDEETAVIITEQVNKQIFEPIAVKVAGAAPNSSDSNDLEIARDILPMIEPGEVAHEVPHMEAKPTIDSPPADAASFGEARQPTTDKMGAEQAVGSRKQEVGNEGEIKEAMPHVTPKNNHYPDGKDPYREPLA